MLSLCHGLIYVHDKNDTYITAAVRTLPILCIQRVRKHMSGKATSENIDSPPPVHTAKR